MAVVDFPASPALNQLFAAPNGSSYQWNGVVWVPVGVGGSVIAIGDTPPATPAHGQQWFNTVLGQTFIWYDDSTSAQWVPTNPVPLAPVGVGTRIRATFGAGGIPGGSVTTPMNWTVTSDDTGGVVASPTWTPPAGRWAYSATVNYTAGGAGPPYWIRMFALISGAGVGSNHLQVHAVNQTGYVFYGDIRDFNGSETLGWATNSEAGVSLINHGLSWWTAHRIK